MTGIQDIILFLEKHGLVNKVIDKLLTVEMMKALGEGVGKGIAEGLKNDRVA